MLWGVNVQNKQIRRKPINHVVFRNRSKIVGYGFGNDTGRNDNGDFQWFGNVCSHNEYVAQGAMV